MLDHPESPSPSGPLSGRNECFPWDSFDSESYFEHNYSSVLHEDRQILEYVRKYFAQAGVQSNTRGIDVGTGPNLYPALAMLPFCDRIELYEFSAHNVAWLREQRESGWGAWDHGLSGFWRLYTADPAYQALGEDPRLLLSERTTIVQGSVFDLKRDAEDRYGMGTMFFVAESLSDEMAEFQLAVERFFGVLDPQAPFAVAFMEGSEGYELEGIRFPAASVGTQQIEATLRLWADDFETQHIAISGKPLREGYQGMIIAVGRARGPV